MSDNDSLPTVVPLRIVSGGQTGVDRAALDAALAASVPCGGWCPAGRRAEDGPIPDCYPLREAPSPDYAERTRLNVRDSDATLVLTSGLLMGGTALTVEHAQELGRPAFVLNPRQEDRLAEVLAWLRAHAIQTLNVAGPRASEAPDLYADARRFLDRLLAAVLSRPPSQGA